MPNYYAQAVLAPLSGASEDVNVNIFAVHAETALSSIDAGSWATAIKTFYDTCKVAGALRGRATTGHRAKFYAADTAVPNYPIFEESFALATGATNFDLPAEVSLCASYANDSQTSIPRARRRGRIYISGWATGTNSLGRPTTAAVEALAQAYADYCDDVNGINDLTAGVWSRVNATVYDIERVFVDNEWDTMRSRGGRSTLRDTITVVP